MYIDPTKLHFTATNFSQNILVITSPVEPSPITLLTPKKWVHRFCLIVLPPCEIEAFYAVRVLYIRCIFLVIMLLKSHVNVHKTHLRCPENTLYFRPSQEHVHRPHQTTFHCHQLFPKHFGNHQPSRAQPHHTLETKKWVHSFCMIVLPPFEIKAFYAVRVLYARCIFWL